MYECNQNTLQKGCVSLWSRLLSWAKDTWQHLCCRGGIVKDILGYDIPHYIKPTDFLEPLGDKKFISMHVEYISFNGVVNELIVNGRINDSPALAGLMGELDDMKSGGAGIRFRTKIKEAHG